MSTTRIDPLPAVGVAPRAGETPVRSDDGVGFRPVFHQALYAEKPAAEPPDATKDAAAPVSRRPTGDSDSAEHDEEAAVAPSTAAPTDRTTDDEVDVDPEATVVDAVPTPADPAAVAGAASLSVDGAVAAAEAPAENGNAGNADSPRSGATADANGNATTAPAATYGREAGDDPQAAKLASHNQADGAATAADELELSDSATDATAKDASDTSGKRGKLPAKKSTEANATGSESASRPPENSTAIAGANHDAESADESTGLADRVSRSDDDAADERPAAPHVATGAAADGAEDPEANSLESGARLPAADKPASDDAGRTSSASPTVAAQAPAAGHAATLRSVGHRGVADARAAGETDAAGADQRARFVGRVEGAIRAAQLRDGRVQVRLSPPELGSLRIELTIQQGVLSARVEAQTPAARNLLLENLPALRDRLAQQDIRVDRFDVDVGRDGGGGAGHGGTQDRPSEEPLWRHADAGRGRPAARPAAPAVAAARPSAPIEKDAALDVRV